MRKDKKEIERLQEDIYQLNIQIGSLLRQQSIDQDAKKVLREDLSAEKEKYAVLLERHVSMMEKTARLNEQAVEIIPESIVVEHIFLDIEALIFKWQHENAYDYQLDNGIQELKQKYLGRSAK